jgi:probable addiction module antidote protein
MTRSVPYKDYLYKALTDPIKAAEYLNAALEEDDLPTFILALKDVVEAVGGGVGNVAKKSHLNRENLYKMLSKHGNPRLSSLKQLMQSLGLEMQVAPQKSILSDNNNRV